MELHKERGLGIRAYFKLFLAYLTVIMFMKSIVKMTNIVRDTYHWNQFVLICSVTQYCLTLCNPMESTRFLCPWNSSAWNFSRQEYWSGLPFPSPVDLPNPGIKPTSLVSGALAGGLFYHCATWEAYKTNLMQC